MTGYSEVNFSYQAITLFDPFHGVTLGKCAAFPYH